MDSYEQTNQPYPTFCENQGLQKIWRESYQMQTLIIILHTPTIDVNN